VAAGRRLVCVAGQTALAPDFAIAGEDDLDSAIVGDDDLAAQARAAMESVEIEVTALLS
jgi:enamine deaminase RidA (YjgF/YER057c/UK114 family)